jgi:hypothetical protein
MMLKIIRYIFGAGLSLFGLLGFAFGILSAFDPIGAQLADDHNPMATPLTLSESIRVIALYIVILLIGLGLLFAPLWKRKTAWPVA